MKGTGMRPFKRGMRMAMGIAEGEGCGEKKKRKEKHAKRITQDKKIKKESSRAKCVKNYSCIEKTERENNPP